MVWSVAAKSASIVHAGLNDFEKISNWDYFDILVWFAILEGVIIIMCVIFAGTCTKQRCLIRKSVVSLQHDSIQFKMVFLTHILPLTNTEPPAIWKLQRATLWLWSNLDDLFGPQSFYLKQQCVGFRICRMFLWQPREDKLVAIVSIFYYHPIVVTCQVKRWFI